MSPPHRHGFRKVRRQLRRWGGEGLVLLGLVRCERLAGL